MHQVELIRPVRDLFRGQKIEVPDVAGVYAFWWIGDRSTLMSANRSMELKGPGKSRVTVEYKDWWPPEFTYPCLYVGKSTNLKKRFSLHVMRGTKGRVHRSPIGNAKEKPKTSSCQLRFGIEHVFSAHQDSLEIIYRDVGFSCRTDFGENATAERFFEEDRLVGYLRPWFNIDSER